jgi:hypothetical protein
MLLSSVGSIIVRLTALQSYARNWLLLLISTVNINCVSATMFKTNERYKTANATRCETVYHKPEYTFHSHVRTRLWKIKTFHFSQCQFTVLPISFSVPNTSTRFLIRKKENLRLERTFFFFQQRKAAFPILSKPYITKYSVECSYALKAAFLKLPIWWQNQNTVQYFRAFSIRGSQPMRRDPEVGRVFHK